MVRPTKPSFSNQSIASSTSENAFQVEFQRGAEITGAIINYVNGCLASMKRSAFYSAYGTVVNASMTGKSRAFSELPSCGVFVINICFQSHNSGNEPKRSLDIADWFLDVHAETANAVERLYCSILICALEALADHIESNPAANLTDLATLWANEQLTSRFWSEIIFKATGPKWQTAKLGKEFTATEERLRLLLTRFDDEGVAPLRILFFFDEASKLVSDEDAVEGITRFNIEI